MIVLPSPLAATEYIYSLVPPKSRWLLPLVALMNRTLESPPLATTMSSATKLTLVTSLVNWFCTVRSWSPVRVSQTFSTMSAPLDTSTRPSARHVTPSTWCV